MSTVSSRSHPPRSMSSAFSVPQQFQQSTAIPAFSPPEYRRVLGPHEVMRSVSPPSVVSTTTHTTGMRQIAMGMGERVVGEHVVEHEVLAHGGRNVLSERVIEHEVKVPKRVIREDMIEKVIVVPEKVVREDIVEDTVHVVEKIIEVAKPVIQEKIVEVPEIKYIEKVVEVVEKVVKEKVREVPRVEIKERIVEVPKIVTEERIVEVPEYEYRQVPVEKIIEVPQIQEQIVLREVPVPQYVEKPVPEYRTVEVAQDVEHNVPVPVEAVTSFAYKLPKLQPVYNPVDITLYVPRFVEVPVPAEFMEEGHKAQAIKFAEQVNTLAMQKAASLSEVEVLAGSIKNAEFGGVFEASNNKSQMISGAWNAGRINIDAADAKQFHQPQQFQQHFHQPQQSHQIHQPHQFQQPQQFQQSHQIQQPQIQQIQQHQQMGAQQHRPVMTVGGAAVHPSMSHAMQRQQ